MNFMHTKIAVIAMVKNEEDIIESFVRHVFSYADVLFVADHKSSDDTCKILKLLQKEGFEIRIEEVEQNGYFQAEVMTRLLYHAIEEESADIIVAADADEFLVMNDEQADASQLHMVLQSMDISKVHYIPLRDYALLDEENEQDKFLLSRSCCCQGENNRLYKVIIGRDAAQKYHFSISQGNHKVLLPEGELAPDYFDMVHDDIHIAHFQWRNKEQRLSKALCGWLTNVEGFSEYTYYANHWKGLFHDFVERGEIPNIQLNNPIVASLSQYTGCYKGVQESVCKGKILRYTRNKSHCLINVLRLAETLASSCCRLRTVANRRLVSVLLVYDGNFDALQESLRSVMAQIYPYFEVLLLDYYGDGQERLKQLASQWNPQPNIILISPPIVQRLNEEVEGEYVQWVLPGDVLAPTKLISMLDVMENHQELSIVFSLGHSINAEDSFCPPILSLPAGEKGQLIPPNALGKPMLLQGALITSGLSGVLFRCEIMKQTKWLSDYFIGARIMELSFWIQMNAKFSLLLIEEPLVTAAHRWTADEYILHEMEWHYLMDSFRGQSILEEEEYQAALGNFEKEFKWMKDKICSQASSELYAEYVKKMRN